MALSPDGKMLATAGTGGSILLWEVATGKRLRRWQAHQQLVTALGWSADGKILVSAGVDTTILVWNLNNLPDGDAKKPLDGEQDAVLRELGGSWQRSNTGSVERLSLRNRDITDDDIAVLDRFPHLTQLDLSNTQVTNDGLRHVAKLSNLFRLQLDSTQITDAGLVHLKTLGKLGSRHRQAATSLAGASTIGSRP